MLLCGTGTGDNKLYFDCPPVWCASTSGPSDRMCWRLELCRTICVIVDWSASGAGSGRGGGIRGWKDNSTGERDSGFGVSKIHAARSSLRDRKWDHHIRSPCCHMTRRLRIGFRNAKRNRAPSPQMYCTNHRAWAPLLSLSNSIVFGVNASLPEAFSGFGSSFEKNFGGRGGDGGVHPVNIIASSKASVAAPHTAVSPVNVPGQGARPITSSPSVSSQAHGTWTSCGKLAMAVVKRK